MHCGESEFLRRTLLVPQTPISPPRCRTPLLGPHVGQSGSTQSAGTKGGQGKGAGVGGVGKVCTRGKGRVAAATAIAALAVATSGEGGGEGGCARSNSYKRTINVYIVATRQMGTTINNHGGRQTLAAQYARLQHDVGPQVGASGSCHRKNSSPQFTTFTPTEAMQCEPPKEVSKQTVPATMPMVLLGYVPGWS